MGFLFLSFFAGLLTVLAPCVLPLLPVIVGGSLVSGSKRKPFVITLSLAVSIIIFTLVLKVSTAFITVPPSIWSYLSGGILVLFGLNVLFPVVWARIVSSLSLESKANRLLGTGYSTGGLWGDILIGAALGPVFSTCSPTYSVILVTILPVRFGLGLIYLIAYVAGLSLMLLLIALLGQRFVEKLDMLSRPESIFKRVLGVLFIGIGLLIISRLDVPFETYLANQLPFDVTRTESVFLNTLK